MKLPMILLPLYVVAIEPKVQLQVGHGEGWKSSI